MQRLRQLCLLLALLYSNTGHATPSQGIVVIVASGSPANTLSIEKLALIYRRKKNFWENGQRIQPVNLPASHPLRRAFSMQVFNHTPEDMDDYWRDMYFHGVLPPFVLGSEEAVIRLVASTPGAIGYISHCTVDHRVSVLLILDGGPQCPHAN